MGPRYLTRTWRKTLATSLVLFGVVLWVAAVVVHVTPVDARDVTVPYIGARLVGIATGGASVAGAIILLATG
jgi:hypothetical protein